MERGDAAGGCCLRTPPPAEEDVAVVAGGQFGPWPRFEDAETEEGEEQPPAPRVGVAGECVDGGRSGDKALHAPRSGEADVDAVGSGARNEEADADADDEEEDGAHVAGGVAGAGHGFLHTRAHAVPLGRVCVHDLRVRGGEDGEVGVVENKRRSV